MAVERKADLPARLNSPFYRLSRGTALLVKAVFTHAKIAGAEHMPRTGGVLVVSNHLSNADPVVLTAASPRPLAFMAKEELWQKPFSRLVIQAWASAFPVKRGQTDIRAVRNALQLLQAGYPVVLFAEGTRRPDGLGRPHPGIGYLASRAHCPVVPVAISGTQTMASLQGILRRPTFSVRFGPPFSVAAEGRNASEIADEIMLHIAALLPPERRGAYADLERSQHVSVG